MIQSAEIRHGGALPVVGRFRRVTLTFRRWPMFSTVIIVLLVVSGAFAHWIAPHEHELPNLYTRNLPPSFVDSESDYLLGTDSVGRDMLSRIIYGARVSLIVAGVTFAISGTAGTLLGLVSVYYGGWVDELIMRIVDIKLALPFILLGMVMVIVLGRSFGVLVGILGFWFWSGFARQVRGEVLALKESDYVSLARVAGASGPRILAQHILPGVINTVIVVGTLQVGSVILAEASLSFLGVGVPPPTPAWGSMVAGGRLYVTTAWWIMVFPGIAIALTVLAVTFLGDWLRDRLDPRLRQIE